MISNTLQQSLSSLLTNSRRLGGLRVPTTPAAPAAPAAQGPSRRTITDSDLQSNYPGLRTTVPYDPNNPQATQEAITNNDWARYQTLYQPVETQLMSSLQDTSLITDARTDAANSFQDREARTLRGLRRYGVQMDPAMEAYQQRTNALDSALYGDSEVNDARIAQKERNDGLRRELINVGRGVADVSAAGLGNASGMQAQRYAANKQASAAYDAQNMQTGAALAAAAIMFL